MKADDGELEELERAAMEALPVLGPSAATTWRPANDAGVLWDDDRI